MPESLIVLPPGSYPVRSPDGTETTASVSARVAGSLSPASPQAGDLVTVSGDNSTALAAFRAADVQRRWELDGVEISGETGTTYQTVAGDAGGELRAGWRGPNDAAWSYTTTVTVSATVNPEAGLTLDATIPVGVVTNTEILPDNRSQSVVMACDFTGLDGSSGGLIFEHGGAGTGCLVAFEADGTFIIRCGDGGELSPGWPAGTAYIEMTSGQPSGTGTLVWEFNVSTGGVRAWWNDSPLGTPAGSFSGDWTGGDGGGFMDGEIGASTTGLGSHVPNTPPRDVVTHATVTPLRVYFNQLSGA